MLQAVGRTPNGKEIAAEKAGVSVTDRGIINVDIQVRTNVPHIFAIGDFVGQPMLAHKAVHEAHVAAEVIARELLGNKELAAAAFNARVIPSVAYTDPEVAWVGLTKDGSPQEKAMTGPRPNWQRHASASELIAALRRDSNKTVVGRRFLHEYYRIVPSALDKFTMTSIVWMMAYSRGVLKAIQAAITLKTTMMETTIQKPCTFSFHGTPPTFMPNRPAMMLIGSASTVTMVST